MPTLEKFFTVLPHTIGADVALVTAETMMREHRLRHLPVLNAGSLVGVLTDRDVKMVQTFKDVDITKLTVADAYTPDPYITSPNAKIDEVTKLMATHKYGCALVVDNKKLVGIFTWVDALNAMGEILHERFH